MLLPVMMKLFMMTIFYTHREVSVAYTFVALLPDTWRYFQPCLWPLLVKPFLNRHYLPYFPSCFSQNSRWNCFWMCLKLHVSFLFIYLFIDNLLLIISLTGEIFILFIYWSSCCVSFADSHLKKPPDQHPAAPKYSCWPFPRRCNDFSN